MSRHILLSLLPQAPETWKNSCQMWTLLTGFLINKAKKVTTVAPIPGETKVWQFVTLMKRIYLIDCPGIVPPSSTDTPTDILLRGVVRIEKVENPEQYILPMMDKVKRHHLERTYEISNWKDHHEFLEILGRKGGRLLKGNAVDIDGVAKMVLTGKISLCLGVFLFSVLRMQSASEQTFSIRMYNFVLSFSDSLVQIL